MKDKNIIKDIQRKFKERNNEQNLINFELFRNIVLQLIPIALTIILTVMTANNVNNSLKPTLLLICILLIVFSFFNIWNECIKNGFIEELFQFKQKEITYNEQKNEYANILIELYKNTIWSGYSLRIFATIIDYISNINNRNREQDFSEFIDEKIIKLIYEVMSYMSEVGELVSVALYIYDDTNNILIDYKSKKSKSMRRKAKGRIWPVTSESHIAHTYRSGKYRVYYDLQDMEPGVEKELSQEYDSDYYRSSITYPIKFSNSSYVRAIFCVTSNLVGAFGLSKKEEEDEKKIHLNRIYTIRQNYIFNICALIEYLLNTIYPASNKELIENAKKEYTPEELKKFITDSLPADTHEAP